MTFCAGGGTSGPGGLSDEQYSTLNLMAHCRQGALGYNLAKCEDCRHREWYASSCGDRHCPNCLGPRQADWSEKVCGRMPDCPHFHVVFTMPGQLHEIFELNYRILAGELFAGAAETLQLFQKNNWRMEGGFLAVLHTWGRALNWHPHLHVLVSAGGRDCATGQWRQARPNYLFPVRSMSKVFGAILLRRIEALEGDPEVRWPAGLDTPEIRRDWRRDLAGRHWNIFSRATLGNTRAVVRYLARYTSRIAISNQRIKRIDEEQRTVSFEWKDYKDGERTKEMTMSGAVFLRSFTRHMVPKRFRRIRYFGLLAGRKGRHRSLPGAPAESIGEKNRENTPPGLPFLWRLPMAVYAVQFPTGQTTALHPPDRPGSRPGREKSLFPIPSDERSAPRPTTRIMLTPTNPSPGFMLPFRRSIS